MKIKSGYVLKTVAGSNIIVPVNKPKVDSIMTINDSGAFLFEKLANETDKESLVKALLCEFDVEEDIARDDVGSFINSLRQAGLLDE